MSFEQEVRLARLRGSSLRLTLPILVLGILAGVETYLLPKFTEAWMVNASYAAGGILVFFFWFMPALRFMGSSVEVTSVRVSIRAGIFGKVRQSVALEDIRGLERSGAVITLQLRGLEPELRLPRLSRAKEAAAELERLIGRK